MYNILIVDDEEKHVFATISYLNSQGFRSFGANSSEKALTLLKKVKTDLIILDIMMPDIDGYSFIKQLKSDSQIKSIPFVFLTAKGMTQDRIKGYDIGCSGYMPKPFDPEELIAIINNVLSRKRDTVFELSILLKEVKCIRTDLEIYYDLSTRLQKSLNLTPREATVLKYVLEGLRNKDIAIKLRTSVRNIEKYVTKLLSKTGTATRTALLSYCYCYLNKNLLKANDGIRTRE